LQPEKKVRFVTPHPVPLPKGEGERWTGRRRGGGRRGRRGGGGPHGRGRR
jgi:hypothetical protein